MKRIAIVAGGWHFPMHFYATVPELVLPPEWKADYFVVTHRSPDLAVVREEKLGLPMGDDFVSRADYAMYCGLVFPATQVLHDLGWEVQEAPNTCGDWGFFNQWLAQNDYTVYDVVLNCHDDTYIYEDKLFMDVLGETAELYDRAGPCWKKDWLVLGNGFYRQAPQAYVRGSFEFWKRAMISKLGGNFELGTTALDRTGLTDSPKDMDALSPWNYITEPVRRYFVQHRLADKILYLSPYYRVSKYVVEGERGFINRQGGAPWSFNEGLKVLCP